MVENGGVTQIRCGYYETGQFPKLGAIICFSDNEGGAGHVAIVEQIDDDGTIHCSNSAYNSTFFWISTITPINQKYDYSHFTFQGFIYNPFSNTPITPIPIKKKSTFNWLLYIKKLRKRKMLS